MLPLFSGGHTAYQDTFVSQFLKFSCLFLIFKLYCEQFLSHSIEMNLMDSTHLVLAGDGTPIRTSAQSRQIHSCMCREQGLSTCRCIRLFSQPDTNSGWDSHKECYFNGYLLFMSVPSDSFRDLLVFPMLEPDAVPHC